MIIMGIDPGTRTTGFGLVQSASQKLFHIHHGIISPKSDNQMSERLAYIFNELDKLIKKFQPNMIVLEKIFFAKNPQSALTLGQARGIALAAIGNNNIPFQEISATKIKKTVTGYGRADKEQMQFMVTKLLNLSEKPSFDASDALAMAISGCFMKAYSL